MSRRMIAPILIGVLGFAVLTGLGTWQVWRLGGKLEVIERMESRLAAEPGPLPERPREANDEYRPVRLAGRLLPGELHVYTAVPGGGAGYRVIAPFRTENGRAVLLDRGIVPVEDKQVYRPPGPLVVSGALLWPDEADRFTSPPDREENVWFARTVPLMAEALGTEPVMVVVAESSRSGGTLPMPITPEIRNPHLGYAVTWFGLAAVWAVMTVYWLWRIKRRIP
jgi:surfeit locus 1 family protein